MNEAQYKKHANIHCRKYSSESYDLVTKGVTVEKPECWLAIRKTLTDLVANMDELHGDYSAENGNGKKA